VELAMRSNNKSLQHKSVGIILGLLVGLFTVAVSWPWFIVTIPAGHVGVMWHRFGGGTETKHAYREGTYFVLPWNIMQDYDTRVRQISRDFDILTQDGMMITVNISSRFRVNEAMVGFLHMHVGTDYLETLLVPAIGSHARLIFAQNSTESGYKLRRSPIQDEIKDAVIEDLTPKWGADAVPQAPWLYVQDVRIRSIRFPPEVQGAINRKMEQYQIREEYRYRVEREELESRRKEVEAQGIARFQSVVGAGISDNYLRWKGIDATVALAQSSNAKVIVIGTAKDGMPLILGGPDGSIGSGVPNGAIPSANISQQSELLHTNMPPTSNSGAPKGVEAVETEISPPVRAHQKWRIFNRVQTLAGRDERGANSSSGISSTASSSPA